MARQKGDGKGRNGGGRKKGTPNKVPKDTRVQLMDFVMTRYPVFVKSFDEIDDPKAKCKVYTDVLAFCVPKLATVDMKPADSLRTLADELDELSAERDGTEI